ncbi:MAG TPA: condensation domain-containing protein, partial [Chitinophagaceae bacterium]|nr:condensation domain-containing protein [Chitinophagaceae bacterium]
MPKAGRIPLSFAQERLWFIHQLEGSAQYHVPSVWKLSGDLDVAALQQALRHIVARHEALRTIIKQDENNLFQQILDQDAWQMEIVENAAYTDNVEALQVFVQELVSRPFDLGKDHMLRAHLIRLHGQEHVLVVVIHHIACDGWSMSILVRELVELYNTYSAHHQPALTPLPVQYADYAIWQRKYLADVLENKLLYWRNKLSGLKHLQLPADFSRPQVQSSRGSAIGFRVDKQVMEDLQAFAKQQGATMYMTLLAAFNVLLHRYSGQEDICVGTAIAGRQQQETEALIGFFINTLALRSQVRSDMLFTALLKQVKQTTLEAYEHQDAPFEKVVDAVVKDRDMSRSPLFQVMFVLQNMPDAPALQLGNVNLEPQGIEHTTTQFDINVLATETSAGLWIGIEYCTDLFREETIVKFGEHFTSLLQAIVHEPNQAIGSINMLSEAEEHQLLHGFNDTAVPYADKTLVDLFEEQVQRTPLAVAVKFRDSQLTYKELDERTNQLAHYLRKREVKQESLV